MDRFSQLESQRDWQTLSEELEKAIAQESDGAVKSALFLRLGRVYENKFLAGAKALKLYQDAYKAQSSNVESLAAARSVYWDLGKLNMVQKLVELELKSNPHEEYACEILAELADVHFDLGEIEKATSTYARALSVSGGKSKAARSGLEDVQVDSASWQEHVGAILRTADAMENGEEKAKLYLRAARVTRRFAPEAVESQLSKAYAASPSNRQAAATFEGMLAENNRLDELEAAQTEILTNTSDRKLRSDHALTFARRWIQRHQNVEVGTRLLEAALRLDSSNDAPILYLREHARKTENSGLALGLAEEAATQATDPSLKAFYVAQAGVIAWKDAQDLLRARTWFDQL
ncbi:MAG: hypothetical protein KBF88_09295, partial [Polyangiaceae bacterium]|nr:hypothetical protein [Polyangiaceae bacterium]